MKMYYIEDTISGFFWSLSYGWVQVLDLADLFWENEKETIDMPNHGIFVLADNV